MYRLRSKSPGNMPGLCVFAFWMCYSTTPVGSGLPFHTAS